LEADRPAQIKSLMALEAPLLGWDGWQPL